MSKDVLCVYKYALLTMMTDGSPPKFTSKTMIAQSSFFNGMGNINKKFIQTI